MSNELLTLKRNAIKLGLCGEYKERWDNAKDKKDLIDIVLDANGVEFLCDGCAFGWGLAPEYIESAFSDFINGKYISKQKGYTSALYVNNTEDVEINTTIATFINCKCTVRVSVNQASKIYMVNSAIEFINNGHLELIAYGNENHKTITHNSGDFTSIYLHESEWK